ncbi:ornithine carbamoyltransferase [Paraneptunicella aestuarii]|uniref:ornithine carbamoyltransferase n=1 Tax=Paraneptunicella aestuarii TaxID=2831148 RepID=UPI001E5314AD|nr:ornithine carbamoyltransferase [Paraneptunicella aestuarii]UAA38668.1 ornithine carbamoyltransferase [Paraneptunicella aestuarii]
MKRDLLTFENWESGQLTELLSLALDVKTNPAKYKQALAGKSVIALFEKPSLRTRVSFDIGINKLGGHMVYLDSQSNNLQGREDVADMAANMACWGDAIVARVFKHETLKIFAESCQIPVVNALCDLYHPCQALADFLAMHETFGDVSKTKLAYFGDGNNVTHSLMLVGAHLGADVAVITPAGHEPVQSVVESAQAIAAKTGATITVSNDIAAAEGANALYTDTWISMGDDTPLDKIKQYFMPYQLNEQLLADTGATHVMHCQPAHRDLEITGELMDGDKSLLLLQAENRMHAQNAILITLFGQ